MATHEEKVLEIQVKLKTAYALQKKVSFVRNSTNSTRKKKIETKHKIDVGRLNKILSFDPTNFTLEVEPGVSMDELVRHTLKHKMLPKVVPEFPGITVGGAVNGGALESSSFKFGQFYDGCVSVEILLADGRLIVATPTNEHADLFWGISTSYGTLGLLTRLTIQLIPAAQFVELEIINVGDHKICTDLLLDSAADDNDFLEGLLFENRGVVIKGRFTSIATNPIVRFSRNIDPWYWRFVHKASKEKQVTKISVPICDYLFRQDRGAFWMGEYMFPIFGLKSTAITRALFSPFVRTRKLYDGLHALHLQQEFVIQDLYTDQEDVSKVLEYNHTAPEIYPVWLCPLLSTTQPQKLSSHFRSSKTLLLNIGIYGQPKKVTAVETTKKLEQIISGTASSRKMLYAQTFYSSNELWKRYDQDFYRELRLKYKATSLASMEEKILVTQIIKPTKLKGIVRMFFQTLLNRNVVWW